MQYFTKFHFIWLPIIYFTLVTEMTITRRKENEIQNVTAWTGQEITLICDNQRPETDVQVLWKKEDELVGNSIAINDSRFRLRGEYNELIIINITMADAGTYTCSIPRMSIYTKAFVLGVEESVCVAPEFPANGAFESENKRDTFANLYRFGEKIRYFCHKGHILEGAEVRTCADSNKGWTGETPYCEPEFAVRMKQRLDAAVSMLETKMSAFEHRLAALEEGTELSTHNSFRMDDINDTLHTLKEALNESIHRSPWGPILEDKMASLAIKDGHLISKFTWFIDNLSELKNKYSEQNLTNTIKSQPFYTNIPGYRIRLEMLPDYNQTGYMRFGFRLLRGEFDSLLEWPFSQRIAWGILGKDDKVERIIFESKPRESKCTASLQRPLLVENSLRCGFVFSNIYSLFENVESLLHDGGLLIKFKVFLTPFK